jgi:hypothetical protein
VDVFLPSHDALGIIVICGQKRERRTAIKERLVERWTPLPGGQARRVRAESTERLDSAPKDGRCRNMAQSGLASTGELFQWTKCWCRGPKPLSLFFFSVHLYLGLPSTFFLLVNCHARCKTMANHHLQRPLCIAQPRQDRRAAYATVSLRGLFLSSSLCRLDRGRREWTDGLDCRHLDLLSHMWTARWLASCCFLVFLAPSRHQPRLWEGEML